MKAISVFLLFLGTILVLQGYYDQKVKASCPKPKTEIKVVPMSVYEEQMKPTESLLTFYKSMFEDSTEWPPLSIISDAMKVASASAVETK